MTYLAIPDRIGDALAREFLEAAPLESGAFCRLYKVGKVKSARLVLGEPIGSAEPWVEQEMARLTPSGRRISAAISVALTEGCGLAFVHSHPAGPTALSAIDRFTTERLANVMADVLDGPFVSLVVSPDGWAGAEGSRDGIGDLGRLVIVGRRVAVFGSHSQREPSAFDDRQRRALGVLGELQLRRLRVAVVGAGGTGSPIAETLARMGVGEIRLVDDDVLDTPSNLRRIFGIGWPDLGEGPPRPKADAVVEGLERLHLGTHLLPVIGDVRDAAVRDRLTDVDVLVGATDTHSSRAALTEFAVRTAIPYVDVGVRVGLRRDGRLDSLRSDRRIQVPGGPCLWCWDVLDPERIRLELLPSDEREKLIAEGYATGEAAGPSPSVAALTVTAAGTAVSAVLGLITGAFDVAPLAASLDTVTLESFPYARQERDSDCVCSRWYPAAFEV